MFNNAYELSPTRFFFNYVFGFILLGFFAYLGVLLYIMITDQMMPKDRLIFLKRPDCVWYYLSSQCPDPIVRETRRYNWRSQYEELKEEREEYFAAQPVDACFECIE